MRSIAILALLAPIGAVKVPAQPTQSLAQAQVKINAAYEDSNLDQELKVFHQNDNLPSDDEESADEEDTLVLKPSGTEITKIQDKEASSSEPSDDDSIIKGKVVGALAQTTMDNDDFAQDEETNEILNEDDEDPGFVQNTRGGVVSNLNQAPEEDEEELEDVLNSDDEEEAEDEDDPGFVQNTRGGVVAGLGQMEQEQDQDDDFDEDKQDIDEILDEESDDEEPAKDGKPVAKIAKKVVAKEEPAKDAKQAAKVAEEMWGTN